MSVLRPSHWLAAVALACVMSLASSPGHADGVADEADLQFTLGAEAYARTDFRGALEHFLASNRLVPNRNVMFNIARAYEQLGRFPDAYRYYVDALRGESDATVRGEVEAAIARVSPRVSVLEIESTPPGATVFLNRRDLGSVGTTPARLGLPTGRYSVIVELKGYHPIELGPFDVKVGSKTPVVADLRLIVGALRVEGPDGTEVRVDDESGPPACVTPCQLELPPGPHVLFYRRAGFRGAPRTVQIEAGQTTRASAELAVETGSILVSTDEPNALVEIDGRAVDFAPTVATGIPVGRHTVRVSLRGFEPVVREVEVRVDEQVELKDLALEPLRQVSAASRESQRLEDAPASVTVIEGAELDAFAYPTILEALRGVRGFAINYDSIYGNAAVRGLGQANDYNNKLLLLSDGAVLNENVLYQAFIHYDGRVDLGDVERIEVVRGPASVLYGTGAVSGVVNLVLRGRDVPTGFAAQASTYDDGVARGRVTGAVRRGDAGAWASLALARSDGRTVGLGDDADGNPIVVDGYDKFYGWTATGKAWWKKLTLQTFYTWRRLTVPTGSFGARVGDLANYSDDRRFLTELKYDDELSDKLQLSVRSYLNWTYYHQDAVFDAETEAGEAFIQNYQETYRSWWAGAEARLAATLTDRLKLTVAAEATFHTKVQMLTGQYEADGSWTPILAVNAPYQVGAASALLDWKASPKVAVSAGARFDYWNIGGNNLALAGEDNVVTSFPAVSPRVAVIVKPSARDVVKFMGGTAFRAPSAFEYYYADGGATQAPSSVCGETLEPETVYSGEVEASRRFRRDWVALAATHATYARNIVETIPVPMEDRCGNANGEIDPAVNYYRNSAVGQLILGLDLELRREWRAGTMLSLHYGLARARYLGDPGNDDRALPNAPTHYAGMTAVVPIVANLAQGGLRVTFEDRRRVDPATTERTDRAVVADATVSGFVGAAGVRYAVGVYNLFDWRYRLPAFPYATNLMPQGGRSFMLSLGYQH